MFFNSYAFLFAFLPVVWGIYFLLGRRVRLRVWWMVAASLVFYGMYRASDLPVLAASVLLNYGLSKLIVRYPRRAWIPSFGIAANLTALAVYKYGTLHFPLGISFFTFSQIAYLVDVYRGEDAPAGIADYSLFVTFFPHLLSGPILRHQVMVPQFESASRRRIVPAHVARGLGLIVMGLFKKVIIADPLAPLVASAFDTHGVVSSATAWIGTTAYTFQLYNDFSGYCDVALGVSLLFNIRIPENFRGPYLSTSIQEFWRRWHVSLGAFLRKYVYVSLGGNRHGVARQCLAVLITFTLGGLWHGAGWTFFIWGLCHGLALATNILWKHSGIRMPRVLGWALTFAFVDLTWVAFRSPDVPTLLRLLKALGQGIGLSRFAGVPLLSALSLAIAILLALVPGYSYAFVRRMKPSLWSASLAGLVLAAIVLRFSSVSYFLYYFF